MGKYIGRIYKCDQPQLSKSSLKAPVSSSTDPQTLSATKSTTTPVPSAREKLKKILFCMSKILSRMMQASQIMTTYSLLRQQEKKL